MQNIKVRQGNCRRMAQIEQAVNCTLTYQRIRCCGRVLSEQEAHFQENKLQNCRHRMANGQGQRTGNGQGQRSGNGQGQRSGNGQGQRTGNGQGQRTGNGQGLRTGNGQGQHTGNGQGPRSGNNQKAQ